MKVYVPIWVKRGYARLPVDPKTPMILVGPGTGCAMFRAFLEERHKQRQNGIEVGPIAFFFGCRHQQKDFLYAEQWKSYQQDGTLQIFEPAFSRDQDHKVYVQHRIKANAKALWNLICAGAVIYVSGYTFFFLSSDLVQQCTENARGCETSFH